MYLSAVAAQSLYTATSLRAAAGTEGGFTHLDGARVCHYQVLDPVPSGYPSFDLNHLAPKLPAPLGKQVSPDDDLDVARLVLSPRLSTSTVDSNVGTWSRADELPEMVFGGTMRVPLVS